MWPSRAITFLENHDTGSTLNHWPFPGKHLGEGYAYIITWVWGLARVSCLLEYHWPGWLGS